jgi:O-antigen/teichoic acid export membrane protein
MGLMISVTGFVALAGSFLVRAFISTYGTVDDVGLYNAGFTIVNTYVGMIFTAMATDYYPKLASVGENVVRTNQTVNQQAEISIIILSPIILVFIVFIKWVVFVLYSEAFLPVNNMILFAAAGVLFKALSWAISFIFLAKGASRLFLYHELLANVYMLILNLIGYYWYGLTGLGVSFLIGYTLYALQSLLASKWLFNYKMSNGLGRIFLGNVMITFICVICALLAEEYQFLYIIGAILILVSTYHNFSLLNRRLGLIGRNRHL